MKAPRPLIDDETVNPVLREGLNAARVTPRSDYDEHAGFERLTAALGTTGALHAALRSTQSLSTGAKSGALSASTLKAIVVGTVASGLIAGGVALTLRRGSSRATAMTAAASAIPVELPAMTTQVTVPACSSAASTPEVISSARLGSANAAATTAAVPPEKSADTGTIEPEMKQFAEIRASEADPERALRLAEEGHARFPRGVFWQDRELAAILALVRLGRRDEARVRAAAFLVNHPESPFREKLMPIAE